MRPGHRAEREPSKAVSAPHDVRATQIRGQLPLRLSSFIPRGPINHHCGDSEEEALDLLLFDVLQAHTLMPQEQPGLTSPYPHRAQRGQLLWKTQVMQGPTRVRSASRMLFNPRTQRKGTRVDALQAQLTPNMERTETPPTGRSP